MSNQYVIIRLVQLAVNDPSLEVSVLGIFQDIKSAENFQTSLIAENPSPLVHYLLRGCAHE